MRLIVRTLSLLLFMAVCFMQTAHAQFNRLFTSDSDLPNSLINEVAEGPDEMIWVATEDGLCRFDGSRFTTYRHNPKNRNSLANNFVRTVCADKNGHLLVGTLSGVQLYRPSTDDFTEVLINPTIRVNEGNVNHITMLSNGDFMAVGNNTFTIHVNENGTLQAIANPFTNQVTMAQRVVEDGDGNIWVIQQNEDIFMLDTNGAMAPLRPNGQRYSFITMACDADGNLYAAGSGSGVYRYVKSQKCFELVTLPGQNFQFATFVQYQELIRCI